MRVYTDNISAVPPELGESVLAALLELWPRTKTRRVRCQCCLEVFQFTRLQACLDPPPRYCPVCEADGW
jgi:hypothetical protein